MVCFVFFNEVVLHGLLGPFLVFQAGCFAYISDCVDFANKEAKSSRVSLTEGDEEGSSPEIVKEVSRTARFGQIDGI